ncbi:MAG: PAS domain-containing protein, partial [Pedobacter sp.]|nr:PAS domain-containing protein [Pedobacter sp.]
MIALTLDFRQAKSNHLLLKSRLHSFLYNISHDGIQELSHHDCSLGKWIYNYAFQAYGHIPEMRDLEMIHADIHISTRKIETLHKQGKVQEAKLKLYDIETIVDQLIVLLAVMERKLADEFHLTDKPFDFKIQDYQQLLHPNAILDKRIIQQIAQGDVPDSKRVPEATVDNLKNSDSRFRLLIQKVPVAIFILTGREMIIEAANDAMLNMIGKPDIVGKPCRESLPDFVSEPLFLSLKHVFNTGDPFYGNEIPGKVIREEQLDVGYFNFIFQPVIDDLGVTKSVICVAIDVTQQKLSDIRKNNFMGMISHELKTPLTSLMAYIQLLQYK